jgi:hypothetical protein
VQLWGSGTHVTAPIGPSEPLDGPVAIANVRFSASGSVPMRVIVTGVSSSVETFWPTAVGGWLKLIVTVASSNSPPGSSRWRVSVSDAPRKPGSLR